MSSPLVVRPMSRIPAMLESMRSGVVSTNADGVMVKANAAALRLFGVTEDSGALLGVEVNRYFQGANEWLAQSVERALGERSPLERTRRVEVAVVVPVRLLADEQLRLGIEVTDQLRLTVPVGVEHELANREAVWVSPRTLGNRLPGLVEDRHGQVAQRRRVGGRPGVACRGAAGALRRGLLCSGVPPLQALEQRLLLGDLRLEVFGGGPLCRGGEGGREQRRRRGGYQGSCLDEAAPTAR